MKLRPIGRIRQDVTTRVIVDPIYSEGLQGMHQFSHAILLLWLHESDNTEARETLSVHPCGNPENPLTGVFASRSPLRPNVIGHYVVEILRIEDSSLVVESIDAMEGTPVLDIKAYIPVSDSRPHAKVPWWVGRWPDQ